MHKICRSELLTKSLDSSKRKLSNHVGRYIFDVCCEKPTVRLG